MAAGSSTFHCSATSLASGSSGLGADSSAWWHGTREAQCAHGVARESAWRERAGEDGGHRQGSWAGCVWATRGRGEWGSWAVRDRGVRSGRE
eukprot:2630983-Pleurochrysis_carterae.AAC.1